MVKKITTLVLAASIFSTASIASTSDRDEDIDFGIATPAQMFKCPDLNNNERRFVCRETSSCDISIGEQVITSVTDFTIERGENNRISMLKIEVSEKDILKTSINVIPLGDNGNIVFNGFYETNCGKY